MAEKAEDLGEPVAYQVLRKGVPVYALNGDTVGTVEQVLADEREDLFHGLLITTPDGPRVATGTQVAELYERGAIVTETADRLPRPSADLPEGRHEASGLKRAWDWLVQPH
ncbi:PRC-barrel domain-containing protein [Actinoplanes sp. NPDC020271]|uniref:PRC-barrel domain-containing protein n=1 Tax=Actinoplanes sp. NPDC020271 TaxID=3363896 RepID=UPI0037ADA47E